MVKLVLAARLVGFHSVVIELSSKQKEICKIGLSNGLKTVCYFSNSIAYHVLMLQSFSHYCPPWGTAAWVVRWGKVIYLAVEVTDMLKSSFYIFVNEVKGKLKRYMLCCCFKMRV